MMVSMRKSIALALCAAAISSTIITPTAYAAAGTETTIQQVVGALEIIEGDASGNLNLSDAVTRAQYAKMLVAASTLRDSTASAGNASPFRDVPSASWAAGYIKTAVSQGWITGYLDGSYRPNSAVTVAEAVTGALKLLGYTSTDFAGSFPAAQMSLGASSGLLDGISGDATTAMTRQDCMRLFYNLLSANTKAKTGESTSQKYAVTLGYALDTNGDPNYSAILEKGMDGPVVVPASGWRSALSFTPTTVYRDDAAATISSLQPWDVLYYSQARGTVWAYSRRVTGTLEAATPSKDAATEITVAGQKYTVSGTLVTSQLGNGGGISLGDSITLLFGKSGSVVAVYPAANLQSDVIGVVTKLGGQSTTAVSTGAPYTQNTLELTASDGQTYTVPYGKSGLAVGNMVRYTTGSTGAVMLTPKTGVAGLFSATENTLGTRKLSSSCNILEVAGSVGIRVYPARLDGMNITGAQILHSETNAAGEITQLFLKDCTGDAYRYGLVLGAAENTVTNTSGYTFMIDGKQNTIAIAEGVLGISAAPAQLTVKDGKVIAAKQLSQLSNVTHIDSAALIAGGKTYTLSDSTSVYLYENDSFVSMLNKNELSVAKYSLTAYYDKVDSDGGRVRVIVARAK